MQGSQYTFKLVQVCTPEPCKLIILYRKLQRFACAKFTNPESVGSSAIRLSAGSVVNGQAARCQCCLAWTNSYRSSGGLRSVSSYPVSVPSHPVLSPAHTQSSCKWLHQRMYTPFPATLHVCQLPTHYNKRHSSQAVNKHLVNRAPFSQQLAEFKAFCTNPIQLDRLGRAQCTRTWLNNEKQILLYGGHCHHYHQVSQPTLQLFLSTPLICHFVSFHIAAKHSHLTVRNFLSCAKRVLRWWQTKPGGKHPSFVERLQWLQTLGEKV